MGKTGRDWMQIYGIYGVGDWQTPLFLLIHAVFFSALSVFFLLYFEPICVFFQLFVPGPAGFAAGFTGSVTTISALCLFFAAGNIFYSSVPLHWEMAQRMVNAVGDWSSVKNALDLGCDRVSSSTPTAAFVHRVGKEFGQRTAVAEAERMRVLEELVRVLKPGGVAHTLLKHKWRIESCHFWRRRL